MKVKDFKFRIVHKEVVDSDNTKVTFFYNKDAIACIDKKKFNESEIELYTGFNDDNDVMIYQGDVITCKNPPFSDDEKIYLVDWNEDGYILYSLDENNKNQPLINLKLLKEIYVIGNKHTGFTIKKGNEYVKAMLHVIDDE